ncbi:MAG: TPR repeat protein [Pseudomonas sp.]|jgi:TPR repeat protein
MFWALRARIGYLLARRLFQWRWLVKQPRAWTWLQGQFARTAALGDVGVQSFYGHILLFRGEGLAARQEGLRLLRLAAAAGEGKAAYQLGVVSLAGDLQQAGDVHAAVDWWVMAAAAGHPLAARRLVGLYQGGAGIDADPQLAARYEARATELGL